MIDIGESVRMEKSPRERRRSPRVLADFPLEFTHPFPKGVVQVKNISSSGVCCTSNFSLPEMTRVGIILKIPALQKNREIPEDVKCEGAVVRCIPMLLPNEEQVYEIAIFFTDISSKSRKVLERYINDRLVE